MNNKCLAIITCFVISVFQTYAQPIRFTKNKLQPVQVSMSIEQINGNEALRVTKDTSVKGVDQATFVRLDGVNFKNGVIEVKVLSRLLPHAPQYARGFIGVAFRIDDNNSKFECIYIRPANGRATNQLQRNHAIQYFSYPAYDFDRLRKEAPGEYEAYADMSLNEWIKMKIVVDGTQAQLFLHDNKQPSLIVNDLKHGGESSGIIGLWVDVGTEGYFSDLNVLKK